MINNKLELKKKISNDIEVGLKKIEVKEINLIIQAKDRAAAGVSVPAQGLFLEEVNYERNFR